MATQRDIELASLLYRSGILSQEQIQGALGHQGRLLSEGKNLTLPEVLVEQKQMTAEVAATFTLAPLEQLQPFGGYRLDGRIGDGASARVYRGTYLPKGLAVAVKVLHPEQALQEKPLKRFVREARLLCTLRHDNVVKGYECRNLKGFWFLSMEWLQGGTVLERIDKRGPLEANAALHVTRQVARALSFLYSQGIVHRDIKPGNMIVDDAWHVKLIDLGLCRILGKTEEASGTTVGTVGYISPEQAKGISDLDIRSDIYSLGVTLYHMVVGEVPFSGENDLEVMSKQILQSLKSDRLKSVNIAPYVHYAIEKMMAKDRDIRFQHPDDLVRELDGYLSTVQFQPIPIARPVSETKGREPPRTQPRSDVKPGAPISRRKRYR
ncbi:MAG: serine/threonine protein kinase [Planctomycetaceae bacterium]